MYWTGELQFRKFYIRGIMMRTTGLRLIARIFSAPMIVYAILMVIGLSWNLVTTGVADPYALET